MTAQGAIGGGELGAEIGSLAGPIGAAVGGVAGLLIGGAIGYYGTKAVINAMSSAEEKPDATPKPLADTDTKTCTGDCDKKDPCKGLRKQIEDHKRKLAQYISDPASMDNKGFLGQGRDDVIIKSRIASLQKQIANFEKQLKECEAANGSG